jgi:hypothetical protein
MRGFHCDNSIHAYSAPWTSSPLHYMSTTSPFCGTGAWTQGLHLEPLHQPFFVMVNSFFWESLVNYLPRLASNLDPPNLCLLSSKDYRCEPQCLTVHSLYLLPTFSNSVRWVSLHGLHVYICSVLQYSSTLSILFLLPSPSGGYPPDSPPYTFMSHYIIIITTII